MRNIFHRKSKTAGAEASPYRECRSWYGVSFHIRDTRNESGLALCGYDPLDDVRTPLTREKFYQSLPNQHSGWRYCSACASSFISLANNEDEVLRVPQGVMNKHITRDAGRWCDHCAQHGSHHTEKHNQVALHALWLEGSQSF